MSPWVGRTPGTRTLSPSRSLLTLRMTAGGPVVAHPWLQATQTLQMPSLPSSLWKTHHSFLQSTLSQASSRLRLFAMGLAKITRLCPP